MIVFVVVTLILSWFAYTLAEDVASDILGIIWFFFRKNKRVFHG